MTYELYPVLSRNGYVDDALKMLRNPGYPGPARSVKEYDATTYWEAYYLDKDFQMNRGLNFIAFAHPTGWMLTDLAGLRFDSAVVGGRRLFLAPTIPVKEKLDCVKASVKTLHGTMRSEWRKQPDGTVEWRFEIPANVTARVIPPVPAGQSDTLQSTQGPVSTEADGGLELAAGRHTLVWRVQ
jgi:alpha-L-rhamnosidase